MKKIFILLLLIIIFSVAANAQTYYADLSIEVKDDGSLDISGTTNDPEFAQGIHDEFTSKKGAYWLLNISSNKKYSDYIISITLPQGAEFNYLKTEGRSRVSYDDGIRIIASGAGDLNVVVQYQVKDKHESTFIAWFALTLLGLIILGFFAWKRFIRRKISAPKKTDKKTAEKITKKEVKNEKIDVLKRTLTENQITILNLLIDAGGELTQKQLQHRSGLPKATLSRNVELLSKKNIILKQSRGLTNMLILNKEMTE